MAFYLSEQLVHIQRNKCDVRHTFQTGECEHVFDKGFYQCGLLTDGFDFIPLAFRVVGTLQQVKAGVDDRKRRF